MQLYPYQEAVKALVQRGQSVIVQAPTGAGKTLAALAPFVENFFDRRVQTFPRKCIYATPMRVLANQFVAEYGKKADSYKRRHRREIAVQIQTGERPDDRRFEADLTFATIDQVLSSFLHMPYSLPRKQANFNAGAIVASYLVFDEFHLFDPISTLPTTLEMLRMLRGVAPFVLMTATFSAHMLKGLAKWLDATVVPGAEAERAAMLALPVERSKQRFYHWAGRPLDAEGVLAQHRQRTLVVCNTVQRAQCLFRALRDHPERGATEVLLLHSRFLQEHRAAKEQQVRDLFGKDADRKAGSAIVVATQVIEVGLDISAEALHTELAPANAILQRAGRCARFAGETGQVYVYPVESSLPYRELEPVIELTAQWLQERHGERLDFLREQALVDFAHGEHDEKMLMGVMATNSRHRRRMEAALNGDREMAGDLVRKIVAQPLTISADPDRLVERPFAAPLFSLHPGSLQSAAKGWLEADDGAESEEWRLWRLEEQPEGDGEAYDVRYAWRPILDRSMLRGASLVAVHPALADYDAEEGLVLGRAGAFRAEDWLAQQARTAARGSSWVSFYRLESYEEHIRLVYEAFEQRAWPEAAQAAARLECRAGWPPGSLARAAALAVLLHDVGKLALDWQSWVAEWQKRIERSIPAGFLAAHTDYDGDNAAHWRWQQEMRGRPPHAVEGAVAAAPLLAVALGAQPAWLKVAFSTIARHHGAFSSHFRRYQLHREAAAAVGRTLTLAAGATSSLDPRLMRRGDNPDQTRIDDMLVDAGDDDELLAYMLLARALRRADQLGTEAGTR